MSYPIGATAVLTGTFRDDAGAAADPTTITLEVTNPTGTVTTLTYAGGDLTRTDTGIYTHRLDLDTPGTWHYRWEGTGAVTAVFAGFLIVDAAGSPTSGPHVYADVDTVVDRAGGTLDGLSDTTSPTVEGLTGMLVTTAAQINAAIAARGYTLPITDQTARHALAALNADGAMVLAIKARYPASQDRLAPLLPNAEDRWTTGLAQLADGTHPVVALLEATGTPSAAHLATSLWTEEPTYTPEREAYPSTFNPHTDPDIYRGMEF